MSIIYVASIGQTAANRRQYWADAKERFRYTESVVICGKNLVEQVSRFLDHNCNLVIIDSPFHGRDGYVPAIKDVVKQVMDIVDFYEKMGQEIDEIVVNTSGGTEKMSCIIKDALDILRELFPYVTHVWGSTDGYQTVYTVKPKFDPAEITEKIRNRGKLNKEEPVELPIPETKRVVETQPIIKSEPVVVVKEERQKPPKKAPEPVDPKIIAAKEKELACKAAAEALRKEKREAKRLAREHARQEKHRKYMEDKNPDLGAKIRRGLSGLWGTLFAGAEDETDNEFDNNDDDDNI